MVHLRVDIHDSMETLAKDWRKLETDNAASVHQSYDWCAAWARTHADPVAIVHGTLDGRTMFILPLEIVRSGVVRVAQFIAGRFSNINTGLFSREFVENADDQVMSAVIARLTVLLSSRADMVSLQNIPLMWRGRISPFALFSAIENQNHSFQLPLLPSFEASIAPLNAKRRRKKFRHQARLLEAAGGYDHIIARSSTEKSHLLDLFFRQKATRFRTLGLPDVFHAPETQAFFRMLLEADSGGRDTPLQLHAIRLKGQHQGHIAAISGLSRKGDHVICQFGSIDESVVADASPGEFLFWLMIEQCCAEGAALFDFGIGDQGFKRSWCTVETVQYDILFPLTGLGRLATFAHRGLTRTKAAIKSQPQLYSIIQRLRASADRPA